METIISLDGAFCILSESYLFPALFFLLAALAQRRAGTARWHSHGPAPLIRSTSGWLFAGGILLVNTVLLVIAVYACFNALGDTNGAKDKFSLYVRSWYGDVFLA